LAEARAAARAAQKEVNRAAMKVEIAARVAARAAKAAPDLDHLRRENAIPARVSDVPAGGRGVYDPPLDPNGLPWATTSSPDGGPGTRLGNWKATAEEKAEERAAQIRAGQYINKDDPKYKEWMAERTRLNFKDARAAQDPMADKTVNASLHVIDTPGGVAKYHAEKQRAALEIAKGTKGADRKFALRLAQDSARAKRAAGGRGRVGDYPGHPFRGNQYKGGK
jgi:hypothetical protein